MDWHSLYQIVLATAPAAVNRFATEYEGRIGSGIEHDSGSVDRELGHWAGWAETAAAVAVWTGSDCCR